MARVLRALAPDRFADGFAFECLWDCEEETRALGCSAVSLTLPGARERLRELSECRFEEEPVRDAASARLLGDRAL